MAFAAGASLQQMLALLQQMLGAFAAGAPLQPYRGQQLRRDVWRWLERRPRREWLLPIDWVQSTRPSKSTDASLQPPI